MITQNNDRFGFKTNIWKKSRMNHLVGLQVNCTRTKTHAGQNRNYINLESPNLFGFAQFLLLSNDIETSHCFL